jgi:hypothetical protein
MKQERLNGNNAKAAQATGRNATRSIPHVRQNGATSGRQSSNTCSNYWSINP